MKKILFILIVLAFMAILWRISERLGADALGLAVGVVFGVSAGLPAAILVLASERRQGQQEHPQRPQYQPSAIVLTGNPAPTDRETNIKIIDGHCEPLPPPRPQKSIDFLEDLKQSS